MAQVLLFTSPHFRGTITDTPSGTAYHVKPGQTIVADDTDVPLLQTFGFTSAAPSAAPGAALTVSDGSSHTITNVGSIVLGTGGTLSGSGGVGTIDGFGGSGGGGTYANGVGIAFDTITNPGTTTINNTGTIVLPNATGTNDAQGITLATGGVNGADGHYAGSFYLNLGLVTQAGTNQAATAAHFGIYGGNITITDSAGTGFARTNYIQGGRVTNGMAQASASALLFGGTHVYGTSDTSGGALVAYGGNAFGASGTNIAGHISMLAGNANDGETAKAGNVELSPGIASGASSVNTNGVLLIHNIGTDDPHILDAKFQVSVAGVGYVGVYSKG